MNGGYDAADTVFGPMSRFSTNKNEKSFPILTY